MKHLFLAESDYAASGYAFCLALRSVGEICRCYVERAHVYNYPDQGELLKDPNILNEAVDWADWVWVIQSDLPMVMGGGRRINRNALREGWLGRLREKKVALLHGGGTYRDNRAFYADLWSDVATISFCYEADLIGSFENEHLVIPPVNLRWFERRPRKPGALRVGHFPSRPADKGSEWIVPLLAGINGIEFRTSVTKNTQRMSVDTVPWRQQLARMEECDVIVDQIKPELNGHRFGEWVSIATEAAALGRISIANSLDPQPYVKTYGRMPGIHICNDDAALEREIDRLRALSNGELQSEQLASRAWIERHHALEPTGKLLKELCEIC